MKRISVLLMVATIVIISAKKSDDVILTVTPVKGFSQPGKPLLVTLRLRIPVVTEESYCSSLSIEWFGNEESISRSEMQSDCPPYDEKEVEPFYFSKVYGLGQGIWKVVITLKKGKWERKLEQTVEVL